MTPPCKPDEAQRNHEEENEEGSARAAHRSILDGRFSRGVGQSHNQRLKTHRPHSSSNTLAETGKMHSMIRVAQPWHRGRCVYRLFARCPSQSGGWGQGVTSGWPTSWSYRMVARNGSESDLLPGHWNEPDATCRRANPMKFPAPLQMLQSPTLRTTSKEIDVRLGNCGMEGG